MAGYSPKDSPRPVLSTVSCMCTDQTRENYWCKLISLSRALVETELTSDSVEPSSESNESIFKWGDLQLDRALDSRRFSTQAYTPLSREEWRVSRVEQKNGEQVWHYIWVVPYYIPFLLILYHQPLSIQTFSLQYLLSQSLVCYTLCHIRWLCFFDTIWLSLLSSDAFY